MIPRAIRQRKPGTGLAIVTLYQRGAVSARICRFTHLCQVVLVARRIKHQVKALLRRLPVAGPYLRERDLRRRFAVELALIAGKGLTTSSHPSIIHFSVNKAATQYVKRILGRCASECGLVNVAMHDYAFQTNFPYLDSLSAEQMRAYQHVFRPLGYFYAVFGGMLQGVPELERYRMVLVLRDPRDVLVSSYFSVAFSHAAPGEDSDKLDGFTELRTRALASSVDEYVLAESDRVLENYMRYKSLLIDRYPGAYVTKYEHMTEDFAGWLRALLSYCELDVSPPLFARLVEEHLAKRPRQENIHQHTRKGKPGDYREKLQPQTIARLNQKFAPVLNAFDYEQG